jgi:hypothetical protein
LSVVGFVVAGIVVIKGIGEIVVDPAISCRRGGAGVERRGWRVGDLGSALWNIMFLVFVVGIYLHQSSVSLAPTVDRRSGVFQGGLKIYEQPRTLS